MSTSRNAPCSCGSGRKYKHCCGRAAVTAFPVAVRAVKAQYLVAQRELMGFATREFGLAGVSDAWEAFNDIADYWVQDGEDLVETAFYGRDGQLFAAWYVSLWKLEESDGDAGPSAGWPSPHTIAADFLARGGRTVTTSVRHFVEAWRRAPLSFWEVTEVAPGLGLRLRDFCLNREVMAYDLSLSNTVKRWDSLLCQVMEVDGVHVFGAVGGIVIPPQYTPRLRETGERIRAADVRTPADLMAMDLDLVAQYREIIDDLLRPVVQVRQNTDGEAWAPTTSTYRVVESRLAELRPALLAIGGVVVEDKDDPDPTVLVWVVDTPHKVMENTVMGRLYLEGGTLRSSCNSRERDAALRRMVEGALGDLVTHVDTRVAVDKVGGPTRPRPLPSGPGKVLTSEVGATERQFMGKAILAWGQRSIPALDGRTPQEAVQTAAGGQQVIDLINAWQNLQEKAGKDFGPEFNALRRSLGLPEA